MEYKLSHYAVFSDAVDEAGNRVAFSTRTSRTMLVTGACYEFLHNDLIAYLPEPVRNKLAEHQIVVDREENELATIIRENNEALEVNTGELYEVIQPTAFCQLGCYYCGQQHAKVNLQEDLIAKIVERIAGKVRSGGYRSLLIGWFGAEPLVGLPQMRAIYRRLAEELGPEVTIRGKVVTNGLSLKEPIFRELVRDLGIVQFELTLDGTAEYHDQHRYLKSGEKSFDIIYGNLRSILDSEFYAAGNCRITIRCNVDERNLDGVEPLIHKLAEDGVHQKIAYLYFVGIYSWGGNDAHERSLSKEAFARLQLQWFVLKHRLGYPSLHSMPRRKKQTCIAVGGPSEMYDAYGNVFNCTEVSYTDFYANTPYALGNLRTDHRKDFAGKPLNEWYGEILDGTQTPCHHCRLLPVCGGSCPKSWKEGNPACPPFKYNIRQELKLRYLMKKCDPEELESRLAEFASELDAQTFNRLY